jgi:hypothetical protein
LQKLAADGDLAAIEILCATIAGCARAHAEGAPEQAEAAWREATRQLAGSGRTGLS